MGQKGGMASTLGDVFTAANFGIAVAAALSVMAFLNFCERSSRRIAISIIDPATGDSECHGLPRKER